MSLFETKANGHVSNWNKS